MYHLGAAARLALSRAPPRTPALVLDLDETLLHRPRGLLDQVLGATRQTERDRLTIFIDPRSTSRIGIVIQHTPPS
jgi:hypothetical protein